jgi:hypothetical protein
MTKTLFGQKQEESIKMRGEDDGKNKEKQVK